jgi:hypothetical protein
MKNCLSQFCYFLGQGLALICALMFFLGYPSPAFAHQGMDLSQNAEIIKNTIIEKQLTVICGNTVIIGDGNQVTTKSYHNQNELDEILGGSLGFIAGTAGSITMITNAGFAGASAAGITSGLATVGSLLGGGMLVGLGAVALVPVAATVGGGFIAHEVIELINSKKVYKAPPNTPICQQTVQ